MNQYDEFKEMTDAYLNKNGKTAEYKSDFHETSFSDAESVHLYDRNRKDIEVINMDSIAQNPYKNIRFPESNKREDSISTNDAFTICNDNMWYFIEFKNQKLTEAKLIQDSITAGERYVPIFLNKLQKYIYHDVFLYTPATFERYFVKNILS